MHSSLEIEVIREKFHDVYLNLLQSRFDINIYQRMETLMLARNITII